MTFFIEMLETDPFYYLSWVLVVMFSICVHEWAHAWTATKQGDDTSLWLGHHSLNPLKQMGWSSIIMLVLFGIAWGAVPYNPRNFKRHWSGALVSFAGPLANLALALLFAGGAALVLALDGAKSGSKVIEFLTIGAFSNSVLCVFNMLPVPILDGWKVLSLFVPALDRIDRAMAANISWMAILLLWTTKANSTIWAAGMWVTDHAILLWGRFFALFIH